MSRVLRRPLGALALVAIAALGPRPASADAVIAADPDVVSCQPAGTCIQIAVRITGVPRPLGFSGVRGVHVNLKIEGNIQLCTDPVSSNFTQGDFLTFGGATTSGLWVVSDPATGIITVDQAILGDPPCRDADSGTLFTLTVKNIAATGNGTITVTEATVRDCENAPIAAAPGAPATIAFNAGTGEPLKLKIKAVPSSIWPPDGGLHDIHITATTTGGCGPVVILLKKIVVRCEDEDDDDDDDGEKDLGVGPLTHAPLPGDVVGADFGQADFDFLLRARECEESKERMTFKEAGDCEASCREDCATKCEDEIDYHCDRISNRDKREECEEEQRDDREECKEHCEDDCSENCEREKDLVYRIYYTAADASGNVASASTTVRVQHCSVVSATATLNLGQGDDLRSPTAKDDKIGRLNVTIPSLPQFQAPAATTGADALNHSLPGGLAKSKPRFNAAIIDQSQIFLGDADGIVAASGAAIADVNQDGLDDVVARFETNRLMVVRDLATRPGARLNLYMRDGMGNGYMVRDVLGAGVELADGSGASAWAAPG